MAKIQLTNTGTVRGTSLILDEITTSTIRMSPTSFYAVQFDEVTHPGVAMRYTSSGTVQINGIFDEINPPV